MIKYLSTKFSSNDRFSLEISIVTDASILQADVLICDCSGIAIEFAFGTERPVIFIDCPIMIQNQRYEELGIEPLKLGLRQKIGLIISPEKLDSVPQSIANLIADKEKYKQRLARLRGEKVFAFGQSSKVCAQYILDIVNGNNEK